MFMGNEYGSLTVGFYHMRKGRIDSNPYPWDYGPPPFTEFGSESMRGRTFDCVTT